MKERKIRLFAIFLFCSVLAWFISKLSDTYVSDATFDVSYSSLPDSLFLERASTDKISVKLKATGFQLLWFNLKDKKIVLDLSKIQRNGPRYYISRETYKRQIEKQLSKSMTLVEINEEEIYFDFYKIDTKEVPIVPIVQLNLAPDYMIDGPLEVKPDKILIHGPEDEIDSILNIKTKRIDLSGLTSDVDLKVQLALPDNLERTTFSVNSARVKGKIFRFSERLIEVPIKVLNLPSGYAIKTFPDKAAIVCKSRIDDLKNLESSDFSVVADYSSIGNQKTSTLTLKILKKPKKLSSVVLQESKVEFILKQE